MLRPASALLLLALLWLPAPPAAADAHGPALGRCGTLEGSERAACVRQACQLIPGTGRGAAKRRRDCTRTALLPTLAECQGSWWTRITHASRCESISPKGVGLLVGTLGNLAMGLFTRLSDPDNCVVCFLLVALVDLVVPIGQAAYGFLLTPVTLLLGVGFAVALTVGAGQVLYTPSGSGGGQAWQGLIGTSVRFLTALILVGGAASLGTPAPAAGTPGASPRGPFLELYCRLLSPALGISVSTGLLLLQSTSTATDASDSAIATGGGLMDQARLDATLYMADRASGTPCDAVTPGRPEGSGLYGLSVLAAGLQRVGQLGLAQGIGFIRDAGVAGAGGERWLAVVGGVLVMMMYGVFLVTAAMRLVDPVLRVILVLSIAPLLCAAWVFKPTRRASEVGMRTLLYAIFYFVVAGAVYGVAFAVVTTSTSHSVSTADAGLSRSDCEGAGYDPDAETPPAGFERCPCVAEYRKDYQGMVRCVLQGGSALDYGGSTSSAPSISLTQIVISLLGLLLAQSFIAMASTFAGALSDYSASENVAQAAEGQMRGLATSGVSTMVYVGAATVTSGLRLARRAVTGGRG